MDVGSAVGAGRHVANVEIDLRERNLNAGRGELPRHAAAQLALAQGQGPRIVDFCFDQLGYIVVVERSKQRLGRIGGSPMDGLRRSQKGSFNRVVVGAVGHLNGHTHLHGTPPMGQVEQR